MKTTIAIAALALTLSTAVQAQDYNTAQRPGNPGAQRMVRGQGGPQFRGGAVQQGEFNGNGPRYQQRQRLQAGANAGQVVRGNAVCPNCGAPLQLRLRQGQGQGAQNGPAYGPQGNGRRLGAGRQFQNQQDAPLPPRGGQGQQWRRGQGPQGQGGYGPRGQQFGGPAWNDEGPQDQE